MQVLSVTPNHFYFLAVFHLEDTILRRITRFQLKSVASNTQLQTTYTFIRHLGRPTGKTDFEKKNATNCRTSDTQAANNVNKFSSTNEKILMSARNLHE